MNRLDVRFQPPESIVRALRTLAAIGALTFGAGLVFAPERVWPNLLLVSYFALGLSLAGLVFVALQYIAGAGWSTALRRIPEAMATLLPAGGVGLVLVFLLRPSLYSWTGAEAATLHGFKQRWLTLPFFLARSLIYLLIWTALAYAIVRTSRRQDEDGDHVHTRRNITLSAVFLVLFGATFWLASYDWIMSLEPHWASTLFGIYNFAGLFVGGLATMIVFAVWLERLGPLRGVLSRDHMHDLGILLFAFSTFWAYIWFCQYMLIWYADIPEETVYYIRRLHGAWQPLFIANLFLNWIAPFFLLMPRQVKRSVAVMLRVSLFVLVGRWLDLYLLIMPPFAGAVPVFGIWEIGMMFGAVGAFSLLMFRALGQAPMIPVRDPYLAESLHIHR